MNLTDWYVNDELRRIERAREGSPENPQRWRNEWLALNSRRHRPMLAWLGDRLIGLGERLQSWGMPAPRTALSE